MSATSANCNDYPPASASSSPAEGALLVHTVGGLLPSTDFRVTFKACNSLSLSLDTDPNEACVCLKNPDGTELTNGATCTAVPGCQACTTGGSCEPAGAKPPHTTGTPDRPSEPEAVTSLSLQEQQKTAVFLRWTFPYDNEVAISKSEIIFGGDDTAGINGNTLTCYSPFGSSPSSPQCASATEANITGLRPATQYRALLRVQNTLGFSEYSPVKWFSTLPDVPDPPSITCGDLTTDLELFFNIIPPLADNGQDITEYHYQVMSSSSGNFSKTIPPASLNEIDASSSVGVNEGGAPAQPAPRFGDVVSPSTAYTVRAYASNSLGSGPWSTNVKCSTKATPKKGPPFIIIIIVIVVILFCIIFCFVAYYNSNKLKVFAPKLRKKRVNEEPLAQFVCNDQMPMEEHDPELVMNPVLLARMQLERDNERKRKGGKAGGGTGRSGGLARLGITIKHENAEEKDPKKAQMTQVDTFLEAKLGVEKNEGGGATAEQRMEAEQKRKAMQKKLTTDIMTKSKGGALNTGTDAVQGGRHAAAGAGAGKSAKSVTMLADTQGSTKFDSKSSKSVRGQNSSYSEAL
uniref:Fibronectin type-III domain-containing protein n=1 Tax=Haptolina ericina TaxID=156174 RepID=A0A7S3ETH5_9EUKA